MPSQRDTIFLEDAEILSHTAFEGKQYILTVRAPVIAAHARPGSFAHLTCGPELHMRRPISIMRAIPVRDEVIFLYKAVGAGTALLAHREPGESISVLGPIGRPFELHGNHPRPLLIGGGVGMPPMVFLADTIRQHHRNFSPLAILGSEVPFPFSLRPSEFMLPGIPAGVIATMPLMEDWNIACRLASKQGYAGCHDGYVTDLARYWLDALSESQRQDVEVFACGPHPMLEAVATLAREYGLPCQVSLEEFMACGVGGCAGCVVEVQTDAGPTMQRVCVDGPVFDARQVF